MVGDQVVDTAAAAVVVGPGNGLGGCVRTIIRHGIILHRTVQSVLGSFEFVPGIVGQAVAVLVLRHPDNAGLGIIGIKGILDGEVVVAVVDDAVVEAQHKHAAEASQGDIFVFFQPVHRIGAGFLHGQGRVVFIDILAGCRQEIQDLVGERRTGGGNRAAETAFRRADHDRQRGVGCGRTVRGPEVHAEGTLMLRFEAIERLVAFLDRGTVHFPGKRILSGAVEIEGQQADGPAHGDVVLGLVEGKERDFHDGDRVRRLGRGRRILFPDIDAYFRESFSEFVDGLYGEIVNPCFIGGEGKGSAGSDGFPVAEPGNGRCFGQMLKTRSERDALSEFDRIDLSVGQGDDRGKTFFLPLWTPCGSEERQD